MMGELVAAFERVSAFALGMGIYLVEISGCLC